MVLKDMLTIFNPAELPSAVKPAGRSASLRLCGKSLYYSSISKKDIAKKSQMFL